VTSASLRITIYLAVSLIVGMIVREYARASAASRLGDPTPKLWGRLTWNPRVWFDPFGSALLPGLILVLWLASSSFLPPPFAYAKPAPVDTGYLRRQPRDTVIVGLAGPLATIALAAMAGLALRVAPDGELGLSLAVFQFANLCLAIFHLLPIPGLDGARLVALVLPDRARETYRNLDQYLALFILATLFLLGGPVQSIVYALVNALCGVFGGVSCRP